MFGEIPNEFFGQLTRWRMEFFAQNPGVVAWGKFNKRPFTKMWSGFGENNNYVPCYGSCSSTELLLSLTLWGQKKEEEGNPEWSESFDRNCGINRGRPLTSSDLTERPGKINTLTLPSHRLLISNLCQMWLEAHWSLRLGIQVRAQSKIERCGGQYQRDQRKVSSTRAYL